MLTLYNNYIAVILLCIFSINETCTTSTYHGGFSNLVSKYFICNVRLYFFPCWTGSYKLEMQDESNSSVLGTVHGSHVFPNYI